MSSTTYWPAQTIPYGKDVTPVSIKTSVSVHVFPCLYTGVG